MVFLELIEAVFVALLIVLSITQIIIPLWENRLLFPAFRMPAKVQHKLADVEEELESLRTEEQIQDKAREAENLKRRLHPKDGTNA